MADLTRTIEGFPSLARTVSENSPDLKNNQFRGCHLVIDMTNVTATGSVTFKIQGKDSINGIYYDLITSVAITTVSSVILKIYPALIDQLNLKANEVLPMDFRVIATHLNAVSMTYSAVFNMLK